LSSEKKQGLSLKKKALQQKIDQKNKELALLRNQVSKLKNDQQV
jgi:hypothetical protein